MTEQLRKAYIQNGFSLNLDEKIHILESTAKRISASYPNNLNFIISDGSRMYAYGMNVTLVCEEFGLKGCMVSSSPLTPSINGGWKPFPLHELTVFENGEMSK